MKLNRKRLAKNIQARRQVAGTLSEVAARAGVSTSVLSQYETGKRLPSIPALVLLCTVFSCTPNDLLQ